VISEKEKKSRMPYGLHRPPLQSGQVTSCLLWKRCHLLHLVRPLQLTTLPATSALLRTKPGLRCPSSANGKADKPFRSNVRQFYVRQTAIQFLHFVLQTISPCQCACLCWSTLYWVLMNTYTPSSPRRLLPSWTFVCIAHTFVLATTNE